MFQQGWARENRSVALIATSWPSNSIFIPTARLLQVVTNSIGFDSRREVIVRD